MVSVDEIDKILTEKNGATKEYKAEWGWTSYKVGGKMFGVICRPDEKYNEKYAKHLLLSLRCETLESEALQMEYEDILKGFYLDKKLWISLRLNGELSAEFVEKLCQKSYEIALSKLSKKLQKEITSKNKINK